MLYNGLLRIIWPMCRRTNRAEMWILTTNLLRAAIGVVQQAIIGYMLALFKYQYAGGMKVTKRCDHIIRRHLGWAIWSSRRVRRSYLFLGSQRYAEKP